jgi:pimeloyl-ACP methyl ester carboxylesterase
LQLAAELCGSCRVLAIDLLGFGASQKPPGVDYGPRLWQQQLCDFLAEFCAEPAVLVGNSIGSQARSSLSLLAGHLKCEVAPFCVLLRHRRFVITRLKRLAAQCGPTVLFCMTSRTNCI